MSFSHSLVGRLSDAYAHSQKIRASKMLNDRYQPLMPPMTTARFQPYGRERKVEVIMNDYDVFWSFHFVEVKEPAYGLTAQVHVSLWFNKYDVSILNLSSPRKGAILFLFHGNMEIRGQMVNDHESCVVAPLLITLAGIAKSNYQDHPVFIPRRRRLSGFSLIP